MLVQAKKSIRHVLRTCAPTLLSSYIRRNWDLEAEIALLPALCDRNRVSFDVGANWGQYTGALPHISAGVIACEPVPELAAFLRRAFRGIVRVEQVALSNRRGTAKLIIGPEWGESSLHNAETVASRGVVVPVDTLDCLAASPVGFIKVDVEGHEEEVIEGALQVIARDRPVLILEIEERHRPGGLSRMLARLGALGYEAFFLHDDAVHDVAAFSLARHQDPAHVYPASEGGAVKPGECYINNFIFIHHSDISERESRLADLGYPMK